MSLKQQIVRTTCLSVTVSSKPYSYLPEGFFDNRQRVEIFQSCRIFQNNKTLTNKYLSISDVKKGRIPIKDHSLILSIDALDDEQSPTKTWRINKPCLDVHNLPAPVYINLKSYCMNNQMKGYKLAQGENIKVGSIRIKIFSISPHLGNFQQKSALRDQNDFDDQTEKQQDVHFQNVDIQGACRICLSEDVEDGDFMLTPCQCKGSCATVHFECLKKWISPKIKIISERFHQNVKQFQLKNLKCEICKAMLPKRILTNINPTKPCYLINIENPPQIPCLVLYNQKQKVLSQISLKDGQSVKLGRALEADIKILYDSVSRIHGEIYCEKGQFYIRDLNSQFGTSVMMSKSIQIRQRTQLEIGKFFYNLEVEAKRQRKQLQNNLRI